jgi:hypothetical protein
VQIIQLISEKFFIGKKQQGWKKTAAGEKVELYILEVIMKVLRKLMEN